MQSKARRYSRRDALALMAKAASAAGAGVGLYRLTAGSRLPNLSYADSSVASHADLLETLQRASFRFFWEQASPATGLVKDRFAAHRPDTRTLSSIAATGFGLTTLCIGDSRGYQPRAQIRQRVVATLKFL